jgi:hypothetical protein
MKIKGNNKRKRKYVVIKMKKLEGSQINAKDNNKDG